MYFFIFCLGSKDRFLSDNAEMIEALADYEEDLEVDIESVDPITESPEVDPIDELEEGEILPGEVPEPRWDVMFGVPYGFAEDFVKAYMEDPDSAAREQRIEIDDDQIIHRADLRGPKRFIVTPATRFHFKVGKRRGNEAGNVFTFEKSFDDMKGFNRNHFPVPPRADDHLYVTDTTIPSTLGSRYVTVPIRGPNLYWDFIADKNAPSYDTVIQSWLYDSEIHLFVLKRQDGCQYLSVRMKHFRSLSADDLVEIGKRKLINPHDCGCAAVFAKRFYNDYRSRFDDDFDEKKLYIQPRKKKKISKADGSIEWIQRPIECMSTVPAKKWDQDVLKEMDNWELDRNTGFATMFADSQKTKVLLSIYDPMQIVNLSRSDLWKLNDIDCSYIAFWKIEAERYKKLIRVCLKERIHANSTRLRFLEN